MAGRNELVNAGAVNVQEMLNLDPSFVNHTEA